ncbi:PadR family transcriptional regulator [Fusibacter bizertensis]
MAKKAFEGLTESMFYILMAFLKKEMCGIDITSFVESKTAGRVKIGPGTLYTILARYEEEGLIEEIAVDGRKRTYAITKKGIELYYTELSRLKSCVNDGESEAIR